MSEGNSVCHTSTNGTGMVDGDYSVQGGDAVPGGKPGQGLFQNNLSKKDSRSLGTSFFVVSPLALLSAVTVLLPCAMVQIFWFMSLRNGKAVPPALKRYAVIFDAGRSGSRVHIYCFDSKNELVKVDNELEVFWHSEPGLCDFAKNPRKGAESLRPMLNEALRAIPPEQHAITPLPLEATAGLRLLPGDEAANLLKEVRTLLGNSGSLFQPKWVNIIDGTQEGSYLWVIINYLRGNLGKKLNETVGIVDLSGGSVQIAYAISYEDYSNAPTAGEDEVSSVQQIKLLNMT